MQIFFGAEIADKTDPDVRVITLGVGTSEMFWPCRDDRSIPQDQVMISNVVGLPPIESSEASRCVDRANCVNSCIVSRRGVMNNDTCRVYRISPGHTNDQHKKSEYANTR